MSHAQFASSSRTSPPFDKISIVGWVQMPPWNELVWVQHSIDEVREAGESTDDLIRRIVERHPHFDKETTPTRVHADERCYVMLMFRVASGPFAFLVPEADHEGRSKHHCVVVFAEGGEQPHDSEVLQALHVLDEIIE